MALNIIKAMHKYQKEHGIVKRCSDNAQFAFDCIRHSHPKINIKVSAVIMMSVNEKTKGITTWSGHLVLLLGKEDIIDPSYETYSAPNKMYFTTFADFLECFPFDDKDRLKNVLENFLAFSKYADSMNQGNILISDKDYYNEQADYLEALSVSMT